MKLDVFADDLLDGAENPNGLDDFRRDGGLRCKSPISGIYVRVSTLNSPRYLGRSRSPTSGPALPFPPLNFQVGFSQGAKNLFRAWRWRLALLGDSSRRYSISRKIGVSAFSLGPGSGAKADARSVLASPECSFSAPTRKAEAMRRCGLASR